MTLLLLISFSQRLCEGEISFEECSALSYAQTATYLNNDALANEIIARTNDVITAIASKVPVSQIPRASKETPELWDAVLAR